MKSRKTALFTAVLLAATAISTLAALTLFTIIATVEFPLVAIFIPGLAVAVIVSMQECVWDTVEEVIKKLQEVDE